MDKSPNVGSKSNSFARPRSCCNVNDTGTVTATSASASASSASSNSPISSSRRRQRQRPPPDHLLQKLRHRETLGRIPAGHGQPRRRNAKLFSRLPIRLAFCLKDVVPFSAIEAGHVFLGFSQCGQFLLSYTQTPADLVDLASADPLHVNYHYRLHYWLFVPYRRAKKVAEVMLFSNGGVAGSNLHLSFCQWPRRPDKMVVFGCGELLDDDHAQPGAQHVGSSPTAQAHPTSIRPCYLTVTALPALRYCPDCVKVAASYEEDDVAANWDSCVRLSCLQHGMTVHTAFDLVTPYPDFQPKVSLKRDDYVIVNTGNCLHSIRFKLEPPTVKSPGEKADQQHPSEHDFAHASSSATIKLPSSSPLGNTTPFAEPSCSNSKATSCSASKWSELHIGTGEFTLMGGGGLAGGNNDLFSPPICSPGSSSLPHCSDSETTDCESDYGGSGSRGQQGQYHVQNQERLERIAEFTEQLSPPWSQGLMITRRRRLCQQQQQPSTSSGGAETSGSEQPCRRRLTAAAAEKAYELTDDDFDDDVEKLSTFRKKRLAEKTYEFRDEDAENLTPLPRLRSQDCGAAAAAAAPPTATSSSAPRLFDAGAPPPPSSTSSSTSDAQDGCDEVLRPISDNTPPHSSATPPCATSSPEDSELVSELMVDTMTNLPAELLSPGGMVKKDQQAMLSPRSAGGGGGSSSSCEPPRFHSKFTRSFIELDDELISVTTDIEDDDAAAAMTVATGGGGYHTVLPLEVHGSGYQSLAMISNVKASRLSAAGRRVVQVQQRSMDLELFCHDMAHKLCVAAGKKYWYCNDYDVEIVDLDPESGHIVCVAVVLVKATMVTKTQQQKYSISALHRRQYQAAFKFSWNLDSAECAVIDSEPLKELGGGPDHAHAHAHANVSGLWHPAKGLSAQLQKQFGVLTSGVASMIKCYTNDPVINGTTLQAIVDPEHLVAILQDKLE